MAIIFWLFGISILLEFGLMLPAAWRWPLKLRQMIAGGALCLGLFATAGIIMWRPSIAAGLLFVVELYRAFNMSRIAEGRIMPLHLRSSARLTTVWLIALQLLVGVGWFVATRTRMSVATLGWSLIVLQTATVIILFASSLRQLKRTRPETRPARFSDKELPAITIAVPARNEDEQLEECLRSILASDYPKFEVLVLDDCSQDRTPEIIRGFAHDGVRFIPGDDPKPDWLTKNQAYARLAEEASGELILFTGVDVRFEPQSIRKLVATTLDRSKTMLSIMPLNESAGLPLVQSMRYMWEMALPRRLFNRPPVLSMCWLISAGQLQRTGGFAAVRRSITPEAHFAREAIKHDGYRFMRSDADLGITTNKTPAEQRATAIRVRYPQLHRRPELVLLVSLAELGLLVTPFVSVFIGLSGVFGRTVESILLMAAIALLVVYRLLMAATFPRTSSLSALTLPVALIMDVTLLNISMWQYELSEVIWKGRNVCIPVMRASAANLPKLH